MDAAETVQASRRPRAEMRELIYIDPNGTARLIEISCESRLPRSQVRSGAK